MPGPLRVERPRSGPLQSGSGVAPPATAPPFHGGPGHSGRASVPGLSAPALPRGPLFAGGRPSFPPRSAPPPQSPPSPPPLPEVRPAQRRLRRCSPRTALWAAVGRWARDPPLTSPLRRLGPALVSMETSTLPGALLPTAVARLLLPAPGAAVDAVSQGLPDPY